MNQQEPISRSGRFRGGPSQEVARFTESISFDWRLWRHDIEGSVAHAAMLKSARLLSAAEHRDIVAGLRQIGREIESGRFRWDEGLEDVHMNLEAELTRRVPAGAKLHTGRSRNDQVALDMRLWLRDTIDALDNDLRCLQSALVELGARFQRVLIPGYTHLQRAQPVSVAHHLLAYVEMLQRDRERLGGCRERANVCPLGSGALAGSTLPLDRAAVARSLGFVDQRGRPRLTCNSMDAVSDRDFAVEFCSVAALLGIHLSRLAEDVVLWASAEFGYLRLDDAYTTGSSLMPQKKNPDVAELTRGKSGRLVGNLMALLVVLKGLPMTYNRDLQEDKERLFDTADTVRNTVGVLAPMLASSRFDEAVCGAAVRDPLLLATDLADYLVLKGMPFRRAHHVVGAVVALAERTATPLDQLSLEALRGIDPLFDADVGEVFNLDRAMSRRVQWGSPSRRGIAVQLAAWRRRLNPPRAAARPRGRGSRGGS
jgi:argininosuccinate lyase